MTFCRLALLSLLASLFCLAAPAQSVYTLRPDDPHAVYLHAPANGKADASDALQQAIDQVQQTTHHGVVFVPEGRYRITRTIHVWAGIRLIGYGTRRPVFLLARNTPGFQQGSGDYMLWFTDERPPAGQPIADASEFTFYSAVSNIDFDIARGNPAAVAIRFNVAQHSFVSHANFRLGVARAAIEQIGNQASDIHIEGGQYGIVTGKTSPAWQFLLMDSTFTGQKVAAISTHEAGFTLIRDAFVNTPTAIDIPDGEVEQLYGRDLRMRNISRTVLHLGNVNNLRSEITLENIACDHVGRFSDGGSVPADDLPGAAPYFVETRFSLGLDVASNGREDGIQLHHADRVLTALPPAVPTDIPALPPMNTWVNVRTLGVKGDGGSDDTDAIQKAIDTHATLYFPSGMYRLTGSLRLRPDTVLIAFHPFTTQFILTDRDPRFQGRLAPVVPLLIAPHDGANIVTGFGIATGNDNRRAAGVEWLAGPHSMLDDCDFIRGHSEYVAALEPAAPAPLPPTQQPRMELDQQYASLWVHAGGGGIFRGIWSHASTAREGLVIEDTTTPAVIYQFSCEHHLRYEIVALNAANWKIYDLQTEEENPDGAEAVAVDLINTHDMLFANTYMYRVSRQVVPKLDAVFTRNSSDVTFDNVKVFSQTRLAFDDSLYDMISGVEVRSHHFVHFAVTPNMHVGTPLPLPAAFAPNAQLTRVGSGFSNADGLTADAAGTVYFTDAYLHLLYRYPPAEHAVELFGRTDSSPMVLAFVAPSTLLAVNNEKSVSAIDPQSGAVTPVSSLSAPRANTTLLLPVGLHNSLLQLDWLLQHKGYTYRTGSNTAIRSALLPQPPGYYYAPGSNTAIMAGGTWRPLLQSSQLAAFDAGASHYIVSEDDARTWLATLGPNETLTTKLFAERGGTSVVADTAGNVYIASGQVYVYNREGKLTGVLEVPERPGSLCFGGADRRTLFIGARRSLFAIQVAAPGQ